MACHGGCLLQSSFWSRLMGNVGGARSPLLVIVIGNEKITNQIVKAVQLQ